MAQNPRCLSVKFPQSLMLRGAMSSARVGPLFSWVQRQRSRLPQTERLDATPHCYSNSSKRSPDSVLSAVYADTLQSANISRNLFFFCHNAEFGIFISCQLLI